jgi:hypothetical protein
VKLSFELGIVFLAGALLLATSAKADLITIIDDVSAWESQTSEAAWDTPGGEFGGNPATANNIASITRNGTSSLGTSFSYTVENRDTLAVVDNTALVTGAGGLLSNLYHDTNATLDVEDPVNQDGALANNNWGVDSSGTGNNNSSGGIASRNAAVFTFGSATTAFNVDLLDFESSAGQEGLLVLSLAGNIIFTEVISFADTGNATVHNFGIIATAGSSFDTAVFVLGDDNDPDTSNGYGGSEFWATGNAVVGVAVPEPVSTSILAILGTGLLLRRRRTYS